MFEDWLGVGDGGVADPVESVLVFAYETVGTVVTAPVPIAVAAPSVMVNVPPSLCSSSVHSGFTQQTS